MKIFETKNPEIYYENFHLEKNRIGSEDDVILSISPFKGVLPNTSYNTLGITFVFHNRPTFILGYFNCEMSRDYAIRLISSAKANDVINLSYEKFFEYNNYTITDLKTICKPYSAIRLIRQHVISCQKQGYDYIELVNNNRFCPINLSPLKLEELLSGILPPEITPKQLTDYFCLFFPLPKKVQGQKINKFYFFRTLIKLTYKQWES